MHYVSERPLAPNWQSVKVERSKKTAVLVLKRTFFSIVEKSHFTPQKGYCTIIHVHLCRVRKTSYRIASPLYCNKVCRYWVEIDTIIAPRSRVLTLYERRIDALPLSRIAHNFAISAVVLCLVVWLEFFLWFEFFSLVVYIFT